MTIGARLSQAFGAFTDATSSRLTTFLSTLPTTSWILVSGTVMGVLTGAVYLTGILVERHPEPVTWGMWLGFLGSWMHFSVKQFRVKRETHQPGGDVPPATDPGGAGG